MKRDLQRITAVDACALCGDCSAVSLADHCRTGAAIRTVLCLNCGLGRQDPLPTEAELSKYYHESYRQEIGKGKRPKRPRLWRIAKLAVSRALDVAPRVPGGAQTLDVGCGAGELVFFLGASGFVAGGFDPDSNYIQWARNDIGVNVENSDFQHFRAKDASIDLVTMYHVLEHLRDPMAALLRIASWLKQGGLLVVEVPNFESMVQAPGNQYHKPHLFHFNLVVLEAAGNAAGLRLEHGGTCDYDENLRCYFRKDSAHIVRPVPSGNADRLLSILQRHTTGAHYLKMHPYRRMWEKLSRSIAERIVTLGKTDVEIMNIYLSRLRAVLARQRALHLRAHL